MLQHLILGIIKTFASYESIPKKENFLSLHPIAPKNRKEISEKQIMRHRTQIKVSTDLLICCLPTLHYHPNVYDFYFYNTKNYHTFSDDCVMASKFPFDFISDIIINGRILIENYVICVQIFIFCFVLI